MLKSLKGEACGEHEWGVDGRPTSLSLGRCRRLGSQRL